MERVSKTELFQQQQKNKAYSFQTSFSAASDLTPVPKSGMVATASSDWALTIGGLHAPAYAVDGLVDEGHLFHHSLNTFPYQWLQVTNIMWINNEWPHYSYT